MGTLSDKKLFYAHLTEVLDDSLPSSIEKEVKNYSEKDEVKGLVDKFQHTRGRLQMELQKIYLNEDDTLHLRRMVGDKEERQNIEELNISNVGRSVFWHNLRRNMGFWIIFLSAIVIAAYVFTPDRKEKFNPLQYLEYESLEYEDAETNQMDFPTNDRDDVIAFFENSHKLQIKPKVMIPFGGGWQLEGASILDYDTAFVAVVQYGNEGKGEKLFHYSYDGSLSDLPKAAMGNVSGFNYQTYASDKINMITWMQQDGMVSLIVGHRAAEDLARFAKQGHSIR